MIIIRNIAIIIILYIARLYVSVMIGVKLIWVLLIEYTCYSHISRQIVFL